MKNILRHYLRIEDDGTGGDGGGGGPGEPGAGPGPGPSPGAGATVTPTGEATGVLDGMNFREGWFNDIKDAELDPYRNMAAQFKSLPEVFKSMHETKAALSRRDDGMVKMPGADATADELAAWNKSLGVPESADKYDIKAPENLPDGVEFQDGTLQAFREFAHKNGITNAQAQALINFQSEMEGAEIAEFNQGLESHKKADNDALRQEWGAKSQENEMLAKRAGKTFGVPENLMVEPAMLRVLAQVGSAISEDKLVAVNQLGDLTAGNEAKDIISNESNPLYKAYWDSTHPNHEQAYNVYMAKVEEQSKREGF